MLAARDDFPFQPATPAWIEDDLASFIILHPFQEHVASMAGTPKRNPHRLSPKGHLLPLLSYNAFARERFAYQHLVFIKADVAL
jgi:hypothetical protein